MAETLPDLIVKPQEEKSIVFDADTLIQNKNIPSGIVIGGSDVVKFDEHRLLTAGTYDIKNLGWTHAFISLTSVETVPAVPVTAVDLRPPYDATVVGTINNPKLLFGITPLDGSGYTTAFSSSATDKIVFNSNGSYNIIGLPDVIPVTVTLTNKDGTKVSSSENLISEYLVGSAPAYPELAPGSTYQAQYTFTPILPSEEVKDTYYSSAPSVATISPSGLITAIADGTTTITIARQFRGVTSNATQTLTVKTAAPVIPVTDVYLNSIPRAIAGTVNNPAVEFTFEPTDASGFTVNYTVETDEGVSPAVSLNSDGTFNVLSEDGGSYIRVTLVNADSTTATDRSGVQTTSLDVATASTTATNVGSTYQLEYTVSPALDADAVYEFTTTDPTVATIDNTGLATAIGDGFCRIGLTVHYRGLSVSDSSGFTVNAVPTT